MEVGYDGQGHAALVTQFDAAAGGSIVNQVKRDYNGLGQKVCCIAELRVWAAHGCPPPVSAVAFEEAFEDLRGRVAGQGGDPVGQLDQCSSSRRLGEGPGSPHG